MKRQVTFALESIPMVASSEVPIASTLVASEALAANTRLILPLFLGAAWPIKEAW